MKKLRVRMSIHIQTFLFELKGKKNCFYCMVNEWRKKNFTHYECDSYKTWQRKIALCKIENERSNSLGDFDEIDAK